MPWSSRTRSATGPIEPSAGSATVELAAAIPLLVAVTVAMVAVLGLARDQLLAQGAAREAAREAAVGGDPLRASAAARAALPAGRAARITIATAAPDRIRVSVALPVSLPFGARPVVVSATAVAAREPGPPPPPPSGSADRPRSFEDRRTVQSPAQPDPRARDPRREARLWGFAVCGDGNGAAGRRGSGVERPSSGWP